MEQLLGQTRGERLAKESELPKEDSQRRKQHRKGHPGMEGAPSTRQVCAKKGLFHTHTPATERNSPPSVLTRP